MRPFRSAWAVTAPDAAVIALVSLVQSLGSMGIYPEITVPLLLLSLPATVALYGRILARCAPGEPTSIGAILKAHGFNWLAVSLLVAIPLFLVRLLLSNLGLSPAAWIALVVLARAVVNVLAMYALPVAFLHRRSLAAVVGGLVFLRENRASSVWIAWVVLASLALWTSGFVLFRTTVNGTTFALAVVSMVAAGLLGYTSFAGALRNLPARRDHPAGDPVSS